jgi:ABC-type nitrate/sulfonate/bicarbonate transport system permease component
VKTVWRTACRYIGVLLVLLAWELCGRLHLLPGYLLDPSKILRSACEMLRAGDLTLHILSSLYRAYMGFCIGALAGVLLGLLAGVSKILEGFFDPLVSLTYPVPKIAILPVLMVWFGIGHTSKIVIILLATFYPAFINAYYGARAVNDHYVWAARNMGATRLQVFFKVIVPAAAPQVFAGLRVGLALSFVLLFSSEMVGARSGLGFLIIFAESSMRFDIMFAAIVVIAILGFISDRLLALVRQRVLGWEPLEGKSV